MTRTEPDKLGEVGKLREDLFKTFLWKSTDPTLQHDLTGLAFGQMKKIVGAENPPCHPAARYNAILVIGLLDDKYSPDGRQPPNRLRSGHEGSHDGRRPSSQGKPFSTARDSRIANRSWNGTLNSTKASHRKP